MYNSYYMSMVGTIIFFIVAIIVAIVGALLINFLFLSPKNEYKYKGFVLKLYQFLRFKKLFAEMLLRIMYYALTIFTTLFSFYALFAFPFGAMNFIYFLLIIVFGNVILRVLYEFMLVKLIICKNTSEINYKLGSGENNGGDQPVVFEDFQGYGTTGAGAYGNENNGANYGDYNNGGQPAEENVFCTNCGSMMRASDSHCPNCGTPNSFNK